MSLISRLSTVFTRISSEIKAIRSEISAAKTSERIFSGPNALSSLPAIYDVNKSVVALGRNAMASTTSSRYAIAIGPDAMKNSIQSRDDIAIGESALRDIQSGDDDYNQSDLTGTRMIAIGGNAGIFASSNYNEIFVGRNTCQSKNSGHGLVAIGANAFAGHAQYGLATPTDGGDIVNNQPWGSSAYCRSVAVGSNALSRAMSFYSVAVGGDALANAKASESNTAIGAVALNQLDAGTGIKTGTFTALGTTGTYSQTTTTITITITAHGLTVGTWIYFQLTSGASQTFGSDQVVLQVATVTNANVFTVTSPISRSATGNITLVAKETVAVATQNIDNTAVGRSAGEYMAVGSSNTFVGKNAAGVITNGGWNVIVGAHAANTVDNGTNNVIVGYQAYGNATAGGGNVGIGSSALRYGMDGSTAQPTVSNVVGVGRSSVVAGDNGVAIGYNAKSYDNGVAIGKDATTGSFTNSVAIGQGASNNAANRITLGNASIAQIRAQVTSITALSDGRDKDDIIDTSLGIEFINKLRPVDYRNSPRDGEKDPTLRHGFIAQQVLSVMDDLGVEFGGVDSSDPEHLAMTYGDLISPLVKAVQELSLEIKFLKSQNSK